jgi:cyanophycinase
MHEMRHVPSTGGSKRGFLIPIGGAEEKEVDPVILQQFVDLCGGEKANIVVFPTASRLEDTGARYVDIFRRLGAGTVDFIDLETRADCQNLETLKRVDQATGIFITGGNQLRLSTII